MQRLTIIFGFFLSSSLWANGLQVVDIGFQGFDKHVAIELTTLNGEDALGFSLSSNTSERSVPISKCIYLQSNLEHAVDQIRDQKVRDDFSWIFIRSGYAQSPVERFFPEFKSLLESANPKCPVQDLQQLKDQLDVQKG